MENSIKIIPQNPKMEIAVRALRIQNDFMAMGFSTRGSFIEIVQEHFPEFRDYHAVKKLELWWLNRVKEENLNAKLETVLNKLRNE